MCVGREQKVLKVRKSVKDATKAKLRRSRKRDDDLAKTRVTWLF